jgi:hypothetical protein
VRNSRVTGSQKSEAENENETVCDICSSEAGNGARWPAPLCQPMAQWAAGMGWRWSRGSNLVTGPLGSVAAGEPDRRQRYGNATNVLNTLKLIELAES